MVPALSRIHLSACKKKVRHGALVINRIDRYLLRILLPPEKKRCNNKESNTNKRESH